MPVAGYQVICKLQACICPCPTLTCNKQLQATSLKSETDVTPYQSQFDAYYYYSQNIC